MYKNDKYAYKLRIKQLSNNSELKITNDLHDALSDKDSHCFWKIWKSKFKPNRVKPKIVDGLTNSRDISEAFSNYFGSICTPNSEDFNEHARAEFETKFEHYFGNFLNSSDFFTVELVAKIICGLKTGRASGADGLTAEHLLHCHPSSHVLITYICNLMLLSGHVPAQFGLGVTFPIPKGKLGTKTLTFEDFRGITVSPLISKLLEKCILENFESYFNSSENQFGFKKRTGCSHAILCLRTTIDYFANNNSTVNICSLDVAKAFDRVNHNVLFLKLMKRLLPVNIVMLIVSWYRNSAASVCWDGVMSNIYHVTAGVRQGGVLSPLFFAVYVDDLILSVQQKGLGCQIGILNYSVLLYADDIVLMCASLSGLQLMINCCIDELNCLDLSINVKKCSTLRVGSNFSSECTNLSINGVVLDWSSQLTYLGLTFKSATKFSVDLNECRANFYRSFNSVFCKVSKADEYVILSLIKSFCIPIVMYGLEALHLNATLLCSIDRLLYSAMGKIFKTFDQVSLNWCLFYSDTWPLRYEYFYRRIRFATKLEKCDINLVRTAFTLGRSEFISLRESRLVRAISPYKAKKEIWDHFVNRCCT